MTHTVSDVLCNRFIADLLGVDPNMEYERLRRWINLGRTAEEVLTAVLEGEEHA